MEGYKWMMIKMIKMINKSKTISWEAKVKAFCLVARIACSTIWIGIRGFDNAMFSN